MSRIPAPSAQPSNASPPRELPSTLVTKNGARFDPRETVWAFRDATVEVSLDFEAIKAARPFIDYAKRVLAWYAENRSAYHLLNLYVRLDHFCSALEPQFGLISEVTPTHLINYRTSLSEDRLWYFGTLSGLLKRWYQQGHPGVSKAAFKLMQELRNKGNKVGEAVLTLDPVHGPYTDVELENINVRLEALYDGKRLPLEQYVLALLFICLGQRSVQYSALKLGDLRASSLSDGSVEYMLRIPRAKQRGLPTRTQFKERLLTERLGSKLLEHCLEVRKQYSGALPDMDAMPMFPARSSRKHEPPGFKHHRTSDSLASTLEQTIEDLGVTSMHSGDPLNITATRFRRTVGTRAAAEGHGLFVIAELLDHTDTASAHIYIQGRPEIAERIDRAIALELAPLAQAFAGVIVENESAAVRGHEPGSRILDPSIAAPDRPMGTCGQHGFCGLLAPVACYTCRNFQPWLDGPHEDVLTFLISERKRLQQDTDLRIASINDRTIYAVAQVVLKCDELKSKRTVVAA